MGWRVEDAVRILLACPAVVARGNALAAEEVREQLGAARGELATLRQEKLLPTLEQEAEDLRSRLDALLGEAAQRGVEIEADSPDPTPSARSLFDFFRRHTDAPPAQVKGPHD